MYYFLLQYPEGLGPTIPQVDISHALVFSKTDFTMFIPEVEKALEKTKHVVLFGIEVNLKER